MDNIAAYKLPRIKEALDTLDETVSLLEESARKKHDNVLTSYKPVSEVEEKEKVLSEEINSLKVENKSLKKVTETVNQRLDETIEKLKGIVEE